MRRTRGNKLKLRIIELFGTQADFAEHVGLAEPRVSRVVNGRDRLDMRSKQRWAELLDSEVQDLFADGGPRVDVRA